MGRARDISKVFSTNTALATDSEISAFNYLTQASASTVYQTKAAAGLTLLNTTNFTAQTTVSINDVFSATYDNYKIVMHVPSVNGGLSLRLRVAGTDTSSTDYTYIVGTANSDTGTWATGKNLTTATSFTDFAGANVSTDGATFSADVFAPNLANRTKISGLGQYTEASSPNRIYIYVYSGLLRLTTQYTGFTILGTTMTGTVSVYGYNK
jgi:hypothetical protein